MYSRSMAGVSCKTRRTFSKSLRWASRGGGEFIDLALVSLVMSLFSQSSYCWNISSLAIDIPSVDFDAWSRLFLSLIR